MKRQTLGWIQTILPRVYTANIMLCEINEKNMLTQVLKAEIHVRLSE